MEKSLFWVVLVWMVGMLIGAIFAVRTIWREANQPAPDDAPPMPPPDDAPTTPAKDA